MKFATNGMLGIMAVLASGLMASVAGTQVAAAAPVLSMGFSQVGAESEWRSANSASIKDAAK